MFLALRLAYYQLIGNPTRSLLTVLGMIAASTMVAWTVASYDGAMAEKDTGEISTLLGKYDCFLLTKKNSQPAECLAPQTAPPEGFTVFDRFCTVEVTCRSSTTATRMPGGRERRGRGEGRPRGEGIEGRGRGRGEGRGPRPDAAATGDNSGRRGGVQPTAPPPLKGLPSPFFIVLGTDAVVAPRPLQEGSWLSQQAPDTEDTPLPCVLSESIAKRLRAKLDEIIIIGSFAGSFQLKVAGIIEDAGGGNTRELWKIAAEGFQAPPLNGIFVNWSTAEKVAGGKISASYAIGKRASEAPGKLLSGLHQVDASMLLQAKQQSGGADSRLRMQSWTASGLSMLISFFIIFTSLSMGVQERVRQYALLRSVALTRRQLLSSILLESLFFAVLGWLGGLLAGSTLLKFFSGAAILRNPLQRGASLRLIGPWTIVLTGACSFIGALAAALLPAWRASRVDVIKALSPFELDQRRDISAWLIMPGLLLPLLQVCIVTIPGIAEMPRVKLYSLLGSPLLALGFALAAPAFLVTCQLFLVRPVATLLRLPLPFLRSQLDANLRRSTGTVMALSLGLGFYMMVVIWSASLLKPFLPGKWLPDLFVTIVPGGIQASDVELLQAIPGLKKGRCLPVAVEQCPLAKDLTGSRQRQNVVRQDNITLLGMSLEKAFAGAEPLLPLEFLSNRQEALEKLASSDNYCLAPSFFCEVTGLQVDDEFELLSPDDIKQVITYKIAGIIRLDGWHWFSKFSGTRRHFARTAAMLFTSEESVRKHFNLSRINYLWADLEEGWSEEAFRKEMQKITSRQKGQSFHVTGHGESIVGEDTIRLTSRKALLTSVLERTESIVSGMLRMPIMLLWIMSVAVANTAIASIRVRRREMGIMRALGLSNFALLRLLLGEAIMIGLSAAVLSLAYGVFAGLCNAKMATYITFFGGMGWNFAMPWRQILEGALLTIFICTAAALIPALLTLRLKPLQLIKSEREG